MDVNKLNRRNRIRYGIRKKVFGTTERPRVAVFKSNRAIYAQIIDDTKGKTLASASSISLNKTNCNVQIAKEVGQKLAENAKLVGIQKIVFDRGGYPYHGRVKSLAEGAREKGLKF